MLSGRHSTLENVCVRLFGEETLPSNRKATTFGYEGNICVALLCLREH